MANQNIKALLIDDEPLASAELAQLLKAFPKIEIVGVLENALQAREEIEKLQPDLIFLDINMPGKSGFDLMAELDHAPYVIFVTAYDQFAIKAFEYNALDYLLKPVNEDRLKESVERVERLIEHDRQAEAAMQKNGPATGAEAALTSEKHIFVKDGERCYFLRIGDIELIESVGNYAQLYFGQQKPLLHRSLNYLEDRLPSPTFFRANRQQIINTRFVKKITPYFSNTLLMEMEGGKQIEVSQRQTVRFKEVNGI